jgi:hypothetical protein
VPLLSLLPPVLPPVPLLLLPLLLLLLLVASTPWLFGILQPLMPQAVTTTIVATNGSA